ncbi:hypothetical protein NSA19_01045 [Actinomyces bowdenii]|uniref:hypothetical protein n=1 Tax=Actinomyces bowdenii TaxID=131109 RepID=UPI00214CB524|nr:hypothetical protein [Actinomyces bowdenii]MCR2051463.1 hypothetical protein [Actinomyces bowdenii]
MLTATQRSMISDHVTLEALIHQLNAAYEVYGNVPVLIQESPDSVGMHVPRYVEAIDIFEPDADMDGMSKAGAGRKKICDGIAIVAARKRGIIA